MKPRLLSLGVAAVLWLSGCGSDRALGGADPGERDGAPANPDVASVDGPPAPRDTAGGDVQAGKDAGKDAGADAAGDADGMGDAGGPDGEDDVDGGSNVVNDCLPDKTGRFVLQTSGGITLDLSLGNDFGCHGARGDTGNASLGWFIPTPGFGGGTGQFNLEIESLPAGQVGNGKAVLLSVLVGGEMGDIWTTTTLCKLNVTANAPFPGRPNLAKVSGAVVCSAPLPGVKPNGRPLTITKAEFTAGIETP
jgi:hypothetical protein